MHLEMTIRKLLTLTHHDSNHLVKRSCIGSDSSAFFIASCNSVLLNCNVIHFMLVYGISVTGEQCCQCVPYLALLKQECMKIIQSWKVILTGITGPWSLMNLHMLIIWLLCHFSGSFWPQASTNKSTGIQPLDLWWDITCFLSISSQASPQPWI